MSDIENVVAALNLEYGADRRYEYQSSTSPFGTLNSILEGVRRTEGDHLQTLVAYLKEKMATAECGHGFATMLTHLRLNLEFEKTALAAYGQFAREAEDPVLKQTFKDLARAEAGHIKLFQNLIEQMEANAFLVRVYCPVCGWEMDFGLNPADDTVQRCEKCKVQIQLTVQHGDYVPVAAG